MSGIVSVLFALVMLVVLVWAIMKKFHPVMTLWVVGTIALIIVAIVNGTSPTTASSGNVILDAFEYFKECCGSQFAGNALLIMSVMGYVGYMNYLKAGDLENAAEFLARYSPVKGIPGALINAQNYGLQGDIAVEQKDYAKAVKFYDKAVAAADNNLTAPMYLRKAGLAEQAQGNGAKAAAYYERILTSYPASMDARDAEKLLGSIK